MDSIRHFISKGTELCGNIYYWPRIKVGINRLLYPQKYLNKGIVPVEKDSIILDDDSQDETVLSFCELIFFGLIFLDFIETSRLRLQPKYFSDIIDVIYRRLYHIRNKKYATFHEVHKFLIEYTCSRTMRAQMFHYFQFSDKTVIELLDLLEEDYNYELQDWLALQEKHEDNENDEDYKQDYLENHKWYTEDSHRCFEELIKRENYPPLFFVVSVFNSPLITNTMFDLPEFVFTIEESFLLDTLSFEDASPKIECNLNPGDIYELFHNNHSFSDCKFTKWVDEWLDDFDSFVKIDEFQKWIVYESNESEEDLNDTIYRFQQGIIDFLLTRGWKFPGNRQLNNNTNMYVSLKEVFKKFVGDELKRQAACFSIIQDVIQDEERAAINWLLSQTHYYTIFNKLVEYYSATYLDNGQRQIPLRDAKSSTSKKSNDDEQQNIPVIVIDEDKAHKEWFVRVHEKKINAQPDEWNKKLYTCLDALYDSLVKKGLMCESSKKELFIYRFSGFNIPESFNPQEKIRWEESNVLLGYIVRCLITYTGSDAKGLGTVGTFFESKRGKKVNLATAEYISKEKFNQNPNMFPVLSCAVEILKECGFEEVEATSTRKRDK